MIRRKHIHSIYHHLNQLELILVSHFWTPIISRQYIGNKRRYITGITYILNLGTVSSENDMREENLPIKRSLIP